MKVSPSWFTGGPNLFSVQGFGDKNKIRVSGNAVVDLGLGNALTIRSGTVTITGNANVEPDAVPLTLATKESGVITWNEIIPGASMVWTPIVPY